MHKFQGILGNSSAIYMLSKKNLTMMASCKILFNNVSCINIAFSMILQHKQLCNKVTNAYTMFSIIILGGKANYLPFHRSILMWFGSLELPQFTLLDDLLSNLLRNDNFATG